MLVHRAKRDIPFSWVFLAFGVFIVAFGVTPVMAAVAVWVPLYWLSSDVKIVTALASLATAVCLPRLVPKIISLLAASKVAAERKLQLEEANIRLLGRTQDATARLAAIVAGSQDAIIAYELDGTITDWNQGATQLYGHSAEEAIGRNVSFMVPPGRINEMQVKLDAVAFGERLQRYETVRRRKDGSLLDVAVSVSPIMGQDGTIVGGSAIVHDITDRKRRKEALRRSEEQFRLAARATKDIIWDWEGGSVWRCETFWQHFGYTPKEIG